MREISLNGSEIERESLDERLGYPNIIDFAWSSMVRIIAGRLEHRITTWFHNYHEFLSKKIGNKEKERRKNGKR